MSNEENHFNFNNPHRENQYGNNTNDLSFSYNSSTLGFNPNSSYMSFTNYFQGSSSDYNAWETNGETPFMPNSFVHPQLRNDESDKGKRGIFQKDLGDGEQISKKEDKSKTKGEMKERKQRFAFMTRSEVDHLEDGYRWRKYGQNAVKNSHFPRSYYRCTAENCMVKKRVERSNHDSSMVITTYEGQHNHSIPATIRCHVGPPSNYGSTPMSSFYPQHDTPSQQLWVNGKGLLQDMVPSSMFYEQDRQE